MPYDTSVNWFLYWLCTSECTVIHIEHRGRFCLWFWNDWSEADGMLQRHCLVMPAQCTSDLPRPQQMTLCARVTKLYASTTRAFYMNHSVLLYGLFYEIVNDWLLWELYQDCHPVNWSKFPAVGVAATTVGFPTALHTQTMLGLCREGTTLIGQNHSRRVLS
jgi:hypothetical protein